MPESIESRMARIEENIKFIKLIAEKLDQSMPKIVHQLHKHEIAISVIRRDEKWKRTIVFAGAAIVGAVSSTIMDWIKKG